MTTLLLTGASGMIGDALRPRLARADRTVRLLDVVAPESLVPGEESVVGSYSDETLIARACEGVDLVVHLGGHSKEQPWREILSVNIDGTQRLLEAAHHAGVKRVLLASSIHAVGFVESDRAKDDRLPYPRPDSFYGVGKVAIEALGSLYADRYGMTITSVRIGTFGETVREPRMLATWLSADDAARLVEACLTFDQPGHRVIWGMSDNTRGWVNLEPGREIGYRPLDDAERVAGVGMLREADRLLATAQALGGVLTTERFPLGEPWV
jgi:nucleoside-diphosphate-sugar epimerase